MKKFEIRNWLTLQLDKDNKPAYTDKAIEEFWEIDERTENMYRMQYSTPAYIALQSA